MIFDCHTHRFSAAGPLDRENDDRWLADLDSSGITHCVVLPYAGLWNPGMIPKENDAIATFCALRPGNLVPFFTVDPHDPRLAEAEFTRCVEQLDGEGVKIHPWLQATSVNSSAVDVVCEMAGHFGVPMLFHDGTPCFALPSQIAMLARRHPTTRFVLGHCGLLEYWREAIDALNSANNLWGCLCGPHLHAIREIIRCCDRSRLMWGSDFGFVPAPGAVYRLELLKQAAVDDGCFEMIVEENPLRLFPICEGKPTTAAERDGNGHSVPRHPTPAPKWVLGDAYVRKGPETDPVTKEGR